jgi:hypothetical protein
MDIKAIAKKYGLNFTIYIDDVTISGKKARQALAEVIRCIQRNGYKLRNKKIKVMPSCKPQEVTGHCVNKTLSISRAYIEAIRKEIIELGKCKSIPSYKVRSVNGKINHVNNVKPQNAAILRKFAERVLPKDVFEMKKPKNTESFRVKSGSEFLRKQRRIAA